MEKYSGHIAILIAVLIVVIIFLVKGYHIIRARRKRKISDDFIKQKHALMVRYSDSIISKSMAEQILLMIDVKTIYVSANLRDYIENSIIEYDDDIKTVEKELCLNIYSSEILKQIIAGSVKAGEVDFKDIKEYSSYINTVSMAVRENIMTFVN